MQVVAGALGTLIPKLFQLVRKEYNLQKGMKKDVEFLSRELTSMHAALRKTASVPRDQLDEQVKLWADEVRELSYIMEDVVDGFLVSVEDSGTTANASKLKQPLEKISNLLTKGKTRRQIAKKIKGMKIQVKEVADRRDRYKVNDVVANLPATTAVDPRLLALLRDQKELVGTDVARDEITKQLTYGDADVPKSKMKILSIFRFGGLGKTTLAKLVHEGLREKFALKAFLSVGQKPDVKKVLRDIFLELDKESYRISNALTLDEKQLIQELQELLQNKRYFIVIDDLWDVETWKIIRCALKDNNCGSRIITTTRIFEVAKKTSEVYQLRPLSPDNSEKLLNTRLSCGKSKFPFDQPAEISKKNLHKCGGVPLAMITIASLLDGKPREQWSKIYDSIGFGHRDNQEVENTRKILLFSYYDLPYHPRACLLHLSIYPEDYTIRKETLIWKWVGEGFIKDEPGIGQSEIGEGYFNELVNRSLIQPIEDRNDVGIIDGCRVHDLVLDMIRLLSKEENFVTVLDIKDENISSKSNSRRLAIQKRVIDEGDSLAICMLEVRSFNATACDIRRIPSLSRFGALRVLAMEGCTFMSDGRYHLEHLGSLAQLRYLGLGSMRIDMLPEEIGKLKFLQTLDMQGTWIKELPQSIGQLRQLKCLNANTNSSDGVGGWDFLGNLTSLEELDFQYTNRCPEIVVELGKLSELRKLHIVSYDMDTQFDHSMVKAFVKSLDKLQKIQVLDIYLDGVTVGWKGYVPSRELRELSLKTDDEMLPAWVNPLLIPNLSRLSVALDEVKERDMEILGSFPELVSLTLEDGNEFLPDIIAGDCGGLFPKLRYFRTPAQLRFLEGAMPNLECLVYSTLHVGWLKRNNENFMFEFGTLSNLPSVTTLKMPQKRTWMKLQMHWSSQPTHIPTVQALKSSHISSGFPDQFLLLQAYCLEGLTAPDTPTSKQAPPLRE